MDNDDKPVGRLLSRREVLALLGTTGAVVLVGKLPFGVIAQTDTTTLPACIVKPELTEGPYFVDEEPGRSDIRTDSSTGDVKEGVPLALTFLVSQVGSSCAPLANAKIDVWHCDALGVYSDVTDRSFDTTGHDFLRGYQTTDVNGKAEFTTIYPGWYRGRTVHIHFKITTTGTDGKAYEFTSQLFFDDALTDKVHAAEPYAQKGQRDMRNADDMIYQEGGEQLVLALEGTPENYLATFTVGLDLSDTETGADDSGAGGPPGGGPGGRPPGPPPNGEPPSSPPPSN
jgi:protocatechuate 3,4-dioxygenase beta subunit